MAVKLGNLADQLYTLREKKGALQAQIRALEEEETAMETTLLAGMEEQETEVVRGKKATISISKNVIPQVQDWEKIGTYILRHKALHLLQRRLATGAYREAVEQNKGKALPGCVEFEKVTLNVRKV